MADVHIATGNLTGAAALFIDPNPMAAAATTTATTTTTGTSTTTSTTTTSTTFTTTLLLQLLLLQAKKIKTMSVRPVPRRRQVIRRKWR